MADPLTNPHDKYVKSIFSDHEAARDFLQHFLPADIIPLLDLASLDIQKDSFIDPDLQEHFSDLLYHV
ncbi:MAG: Rpn family recombination-promoting nuclease/putative transposase, partial [Gammaproteobacteria bacterium]|nr:Rpn family recombination-promoting nuclease/putative transposase [Gammaproteobacteria bacterium]